MWNADEKIRQLFLHPRPTYRVAEAAALLGVGWREVRGWLEAGELAAVDGDSGLVVPWAELVSFGMERWSQEVVEAALGTELGTALPQLVRLWGLAVRLPRMHIVALDHLASSEGRIG
jgi:hypothetical protein